MSKNCHIVNTRSWSEPSLENVFKTFYSIPRLSTHSSGDLDSKLLRIRDHSFPAGHRVHGHADRDHLQVRDLPGQLAVRGHQPRLRLHLRRHVIAGVVVSRAQLAPFLRFGVLLQFSRRRRRAFYSRVADVVDQVGCVNMQRM